MCVFFWPFEGGLFSNFIFLVEIFVQTVATEATIQHQFIRRKEEKKIRSSIPSVVQKASAEYRP